MYLPSVGLFVAAVWAMADWTRVRAWRRIPAVSASLLLVPVFIVLTQQQVLFWRNSEALARRALAVTTDNVAARICLGGALLEQGKFDEAAGHFQEAARLWPRDPRPWRYLGQTRLRQGRPEAAREPLETAQELNPNDPVTCSFLADVYQVEGKTSLAIDFYRRALNLNPRQLITLNNLAWILATNRDPRLRNGAEAVELARRASEISHYRYPRALGTLAAAYAEAGQFASAVTTAEEARALALERGELELAAKNEELLALFRSGTAYHEAP
jgi:cytochrome c-type biogenesis protein CcmH/NrfG